MIKIGVTAGLMYPDSERKYFAPKNLSFLVDDMAHFLYQKHIMPILIPNLPKSILHEFLAEMDGFVFQGGSDVCPLSYNEKYLDEKRWPGDKPRDDYELAIADYAFKNRKPMFGICRGFQLLNVYFGGTLYQDLPTEFSTILPHHSRETYDKNHHEIAFTATGTLTKLFNNISNPLVNSVHHQGIKKLGKDLVVEATSPKDNLIEAFMHKDRDQHFVLGVQWHPEYTHSLHDKVIPDDVLYQYFIDAVTKQKDK